MNGRIPHGSFPPRSRPPLRGREPWRDSLRGLQYDPIAGRFLDRDCKLQLGALHVRRARLGGDGVDGGARGGRAAALPRSACRRRRPAAAPGPLRVAPAARAAPRSSGPQPWRRGGTPGPWRRGAAVTVACCCVVRLCAPSTQGPLLGGQSGCTARAPQGADRATEPPSAQADGGAGLALRSRPQQGTGVIESG